MRLYVQNKSCFSGYYLFDPDQKPEFKNCLCVCGQGVWGYEEEVEVQVDEASGEASKRVYILEI